MVLKKRSQRTRHQCVPEYIDVHRHVLCVCRQEPFSVLGQIPKTALVLPQCPIYAQVKHDVRILIAPA